MVKHTSPSGADDPSRLPTHRSPPHAGKRLRSSPLSCCPARPAPLVPRERSNGSPGAPSGGTYVYGSYPDVDALFAEQGGELDAKRRVVLLDQLQERVSERAIYAHIWQLAFLNGAGPRVGESGLGLIAGHAYSAPYEDVTLAGK